MNEANLTKFTHGIRALHALRTPWQVYRHAGIMSGGAIAAIATKGRGSSYEAWSGPKAAKTAAKTLFCPPKTVAPAELSSLRKAAGRVSWRYPWTQRPVTFAGHLFDAVLLARMLSCLPAKGRVVVETAEVNGVPLLRIVGDTWRGSMAGLNAAVLPKKKRYPALRLRTTHPTGGK